jgi:hypothetical protein
MFDADPALSYYRIRNWFLATFSTQKEKINLLFNMSGLNLGCRSGIIPLSHPELVLGIKISYLEGKITGKLAKNGKIVA